LISSARDRPDDKRQKKDTSGGVMKHSRPPAGAGAMLVACRLAGLSALEAKYAGVIASTQSVAGQRVCNVAPDV
jgi:hypothetical protein